MKIHPRSLLRRTGFGLLLTLGAALASSASGCAAPVDGDSPAESAEAPREESSAQPGERFVGRFAMPWGTELLDYQMVGDLRVHDGDMILPAPSPEVPGGASIVGALDPSMRWPNNTVPFEFDASLPVGPGAGMDQADVLAAIAQWEAATSIRFVQSASATGRVVFRQDPANPDFCASTVGFTGSPQNVTLGANCSQGNALHEIGHAIGLKHEHENPTRDAYLVTADGCGASPVSLGPTWGLYGLYDFSSMMHYSSQIGSVIDGCLDGGTLRFYRRSSTEPTHDQVYAQRTDLSALDRQAVEEIYSEGFGAAVAFGDFNNDGFRDVAIGAPRKGNVGAGHVQIFRGTASGLVAADDLDQGLSAERDDRFGYSLATGDFNNDGFVDLAVGVPGENNDTGRVMIYKGKSGTGSIVNHWINLDQSSLGANESPDRFGYALASGDFNNDGFVDLAVGAPGESWGASAPNAGAVFVFRGASGGMSGNQLLGQSGLGANEAGDSFGAALTAGDFDNDGNTDLAVGAPHERVSPDPEGGAVFLFRGGSSLSGWRLLRPASSTTNYNEWDMLFGFTLTASDYDGDGYRDLAVGAPAATVSGQRWAGRVLVFRGSASGPSTVTQSLTESSPTRGASFGFSLASGRVDAGSRWDLAIGAPGSQPPPPASARGAALRLHWRRGRAQPGADAEPGRGSGRTSPARSSFGHDLALGDVDGDGDSDLVVGASGESPGSGAQTGHAFSFRSNGSTLSTWASIASPQRTSLPAAPRPPDVTRGGDEGPEVLVSPRSFCALRSLPAGPPILAARERALVGRAHLAEGRRITAAIRVRLQRPPPEGLLDLGNLRVLRDAEDLPGRARRGA
ncbi:MAG: M12 family metallopeptidase [Byssovorax sp.]